MTLTKTGFWATLYRITRTIVMRSAGKSPTRLQNTDLCTMARTILIYFPLVLLINIATVAWVGYLVWSVFLYFSTHFSLLLSILGAVIIVVIFIVAVAAMIWGAVIGWSKTSQSETAQLLKTYAAAKKSSICPLITIQEKTNAAS